MKIYETKQLIKQVVSHKNKLIIVFTNNEIYELEDLSELDTKEDSKIKNKK